MTRLRIGIAGCGSVTGWHVGNLLAINGVEIAGLADPSQEARERLVRRQPVVASAPQFDTPEELYESVELDGVFVGTPHTLHYSHVIGAVRRGLHVLCEKPLACAPEHAREIAEQSEAEGVVVTVSYQRRVDPAYKYMREAIDSGELGEVRTVAITCGQSWKQLTGGSWRQNPELSGGGMLMDTGSHIVDILLWLAGREPVSVHATVDHYDAPVDITTTATIQFGGGAQGALTVIGDLPTQWIESVLVSGTKGLLRYENDPQHPWRTGTVHQFRDDGVYTPLNLQTWNPPTTDSLWVGAIRGENPNPIPPEVGVRVAELTAAIYRSGQERLPQDLSVTADA
ncbi:MAG: Gfo/Idh/MocA family oxidoreductase [Chloroflexota bacterium]|nr:Gfo/Idh/MocA family oxidoreductase [Chloroflexota bacterium]